MRWGACVLSVLLVSAAGASAAPGSDDVSAFEADLAQHDLVHADIILDRLVEQRLPAKETGHPDPLLDRLLADDLAARGDAADAELVLARVLADPATRDRSHYRLLLASAHESSGDWEAASAGYAAIATDPQTDQGTAAAARLGAARVQMSADPAQALATLAKLDRSKIPTSLLWELDLLIARAASMTDPSRAADARAALVRSWAEAPDGEIGSAAVAQVAGDRALAAARDGNRAGMIAMMAVDRLNRQANAGMHQVAADLPVCGRAGIASDDVVIVSVVHQAAVGRPQVTLAWASRPGIARPFLIAAQRSGALAVSDGQAASFALRCRDVAAPNYAVRAVSTDEFTGWMTERGAYPLMASDGSVSELATVLARREARYGSTSVMLLPPLFRSVEPDALDLGEAEGRRRASETFDRIGSILAQNHAPPSLLALWHLGSLGFAVLAETKTQAAAQGEAEAMMTQVSADPRVPLDFLYALATASADGPATPSAYKSVILSRLLDILRHRAPAGDQRTAAVAIKLHNLRSGLGDDAGAAAAIDGIGLPANACALSDPRPRFVSSGISGEDYPGDLNFTSLVGLVQIEAELDTSGALVNGRLILADPPYAFDLITRERLETIHYDPARFSGKPADCRGVEQSIQWRLPTD